MVFLLRVGENWCRIFNRIVMGIRIIDLFIYHSDVNMSDVMCHNSILMSGFLIIECSNGLSLASYYPEFLFPALCSSRAPDPHLAWLDGHYARRELEEVVCSPSVCSVQSLDGSAQRLWGGHRFPVMGCFDIGLQHFCRLFPHLFLL